MSETHSWIDDHKDYPHHYCLIWPFARETRVGRGMMNHNGKQSWAHRVMCEIVHGPAPIDRPQAAHSCGNGHNGCVNPRHLSWASNSANQRQRYADGRGNPNANGNRPRFTPEQIATLQSQWGEFTQTKLAEMYGVSLGTIQYYLKYRAEKDHAGGKIKHWSPDEDTRLREAYARGCSHSQAGTIVGRPAGAAASRAARLGIKSSWRRPTDKSQSFQSTGKYQ